MLTIAEVHPPVNNPLAEILAAANSDGLKFRHQTIHKNDIGSLILRAHRGYLIFETWLKGLPHTRLTLAAWDGQQWQPNGLTTEKAEAWMVEARQLLGEAPPEPELTANQRRQLRQLKRLDARIHAAVVTSIRVAPDLAGITIAQGLKAYVVQQEMAAREARHIAPGFAHAPGDGGLAAEDFDSGPSAEYMRMLRQEMARRERVERTAQPQNIGEEIAQLLGQEIPDEPKRVTPPTEAQKARGLARALSSQQPKPRIGSMPVEWQLRQEV